MRCRKWLARSRLRERSTFRSFGVVSARAWVLAASHSRPRRIGEQIQRDLADIVKNELKDPRVGMITLTGVEVSADLAHAKVFFSSLGSSAERAETLSGLQNAAGFMRSLLGKRIKVYSVPELHFEFDESVEHGARLSKLIDDAVATSVDAPESSRKSDDSEELKDSNESNESNARNTSEAR